MTDFEEALMLEIKQIRLLLVHLIGNIEVELEGLESAVQTGEGVHTLSQAIHPEDEGPEAL